MDVTHAELTAVAQAAGRLVVTPSPVTTEGQRNMPVDLRPGESLEAFLQRHVPDISRDGWVVLVGDWAVPPALWDRTYPKHGQLIAVRPVVGRAALQLIALAALTYFTMGAGGMAAATATSSAGLFAAGGLIGGGFAAALGTFVAGSMLINKVLAPKIPDSVGVAAAKSVFSISGQRNSMRQQQPFACLFGEMRVLPDLAGYPYTTFEGDNQFLSMQLLGGINVHTVSDLAVGDTPLADFKEVSTYLNGFSGHPSVEVPIYGNADSIAGPALEWDTPDPIAFRTGSAGGVAVQVDIEGQLYDVHKKGMGANSVTLTIECRPKGSNDWQPWVSEVITSSKADLIRRTYTRELVGQPEVRAWISRPTWADEGDVCKFSWTQLKTIQADTADYSDWGRIGLRILATGQLNGSLDTVRATYRARPIPVWTPGGWIMATTRDEGLSNPGAIGLQILRGIRNASGRLQFGLGLDDSRIDIEAWKAFMLHCAARNYRFDRWITSTITVGDLLQQVVQAGMGQFTWRDGSRPSVAWAANGQPLSGVVNMANMARGSFQTTYTLARAADGVEAQYVSRDTWETTTLRVMAPGVTTMLNPARITLDGVTDATHAAELARYHLAQSLYQSKSIGFGANLERLAYRRMSILSISHDMTQWGFGGRLRGAAIVGGKVRLLLDEPVPALSARFIGLRLPGERDFRVFSVEAFAGTSRELTLVGAWPDGVPLPGNSPANPALDTLWTYDFKPTPGLRVRVVSLTPQASALGADVLVVPESDELWTYVYTGAYQPAPPQSSLSRVVPKVRNLRVVEQTNAQGDTEWFELLLTWDIEGVCDHCQVWAGIDGEQLQLVDGRALNGRSRFRIDGAGQYLIEVRPFDASGRLGELGWALHGTADVDVPPRNVDTFVVQQVAGELRRYVWTYNATPRPFNLAGVQIRYAPGAVDLSVADWDNLTPIAGPDDIYTGELETTRPDAGTWTFACRAINTAGLLANGVRTHTITLQAPFAGMKEDIEQLTEGLDDTAQLILAGEAASAAAGRVQLAAEAKRRADATAEQAQALLDEVAARGTSIEQLTNLVREGDEQLAQEIQTVGAAVEGAVAAVQSVDEASVARDSAAAQRIDAVAARVTGLEGSDAAQGAAISGLQVTVGNQAGQLSSLAQSYDSLSSTVGSNHSEVLGSLQSLTTAQTAQGQQLTALSATVGNNHSSVLSSLQTLTDAQTSQAGQLTALSSTVDGNQSNVQASLQALSSTQSSQAGQLTALSATVGSHTSSITQQAQALVSLDGRFSASVGLRLDVNGRVSGWVANNNGSQSDFVILGDRFALARQGDGGLRYPFVVGQVNGVDSAAVNGNLLVDGSVRANSIFVDTLSAITGRMGYLSSGQLDITSDGGNGWGFLRSAGKWFGDGVNGWILARHANGQTFAELMCGNTRIAMNSGDNSMVITSPGFSMVNGVVTMNQLNVIGTAQIQGNAISVIRVANGKQEVAGGLEQRLDINDYDPGGAGVLATISSGCQGRFVVQVWRGNTRLAWESVTGSTQFALPAHSGPQNYSIYIRPEIWEQQGGTAWHNVASLMSFKR